MKATGPLPPGVLAVAAYKKQVYGREVQVVTLAWHGSQIDAAFAQFADNLYGKSRTELVVDGNPLATRATHLVAYVGHNRLYDRPFVWPAEADDAQVRGAMMIAVARGGKYGDIHTAATLAYAKGHGRDARRLRKIFSNPVDLRWPVVDNPVPPANLPRPTQTAK